VSSARIGLAVLSLLLIIIPLLLVTSLARGQSGGSLCVAFIDVGQGDSIWLHASDGTDVLIDGGTQSAGADVLSYLQARHVDDIEVMIVSHGDADHTGGLIELLRSSIPVDAVIHNGQPCPNLVTCPTFYLETQNRGLTPTPAVAGQAYSWGPLSASVLNPQSPPTGSSNEDSVVLLVSYGTVHLMFTGDIGSTTEQTILTLGMPLAAEVLKVAHHGSAGSSSATFLAAVAPDLAVISVGSNPYGHPSSEVLDRLAAAGAEVYRTDEDGTIVIVTDGTTVDVQAQQLVFLPELDRIWLPPRDVRITHIEYNPLGDDVAGEYVRIENAGSIAVALTGWTLSDEAGYTFTFPVYSLPAAGTVRVWTGLGIDTPTDLHWGRGSAVWTNTGDCGYLRDAAGELESMYCYL